MKRRTFDPGAVLRARGLRATGSRMAILEHLTLHPEPQSASELSRRLGEGHGDQATIYRNLKRLSAVGLVEVVTIAEGIPRYAPADEVPRVGHGHPHFVCGECWRIECLPNVELNGRDPWNRSLRHAMVQVRGACPDCERDA